MEKGLTKAEELIIGQIRKWPMLYRSGRRFYHSSIVSSMGELYWEGGSLIVPEQRYLGDKDGKAVWGEYEDRISKEVGVDFFKSSNSSVFISVNMPCRLESPIMTIPDNADDSWLDFIDHQLYLDSRITVEFYKTIVEAHCILEYGMRDNPRANLGYYVSEWKEYYDKIKSIQARIEQIREIKRTSKIPEYSYVGLWI